MTQEFKNKIKDLIDRNVPLFYNTSGNPEAYKLCVKHISSASYLNLGILISKHIHPHNFIYIVDFDNERIIETEDKIKIIPLEGT